VNSAAASVLRARDGHRLDLVEEILTAAAQACSPRVDIQRNPF
jgi:hypothetical protein